MKPDKLADESVARAIGHSSGNLSERELIRQHVDRTVAFQRQMIREQEERCRKQMADVKASLKAVNWPR
jgi:hypothetical protein